ncbi:MAG TPA: transcription-repair coupling factor, partial [Burkholderiaceae bacterium]|nr:transcription-repair coupling factor [Burkholderiaceae bacterium]
MDFTFPALGPGQRFRLARPPGSADALVLAKLAAQLSADKRLLLIICADALDAQRLSQELPYIDPALRVRVFPDWETLPYDILSPHPDLVSDRLEALYRLLAQKGEVSRSAQDDGLDVLLVPAATALGRLAPPAFMAGRSFSFTRGQAIDEDSLRRQLVLAGYQAVSQVVAPGEFSIRGSLVDLFPMGASLPLRLDLLDDQLESIRSFDPDTQRSLYPVPSVRLLPGREFPLDETARTGFRNRWREVFEGDPSKAVPYRDIGNGLTPPGIEYYLPLFFDETATLFDYLPATSHLALHGKVEDSIRRFWTETTQRHRFLGADAQRPALAPG